MRHDPDLLPGYPRRSAARSAAAPSYVDLEGRHQLDLVFATYDGQVHALRPDGSEVPGFPVSSDERAGDRLANPQNYPARAYRDPALRDVREPLSGIAVGDLFHDGRLEVVATSANADVYAWDAQRPAPARLPAALRPALLVAAGAHAAGADARTGACPRAATGRRRCSPTSRATAGSTS